jgi:hypothetical protein
MIQPGMMFGGEGPVMQGTWYNPTTGDAFTVRDSFFEDNQYVITTTDGRYLRYDQIQNYVQSDMRLDELKQLKKENVKEDILPAEVSNLIDNATDMLLPEDAVMVSGGYTPVAANQSGLGNIYQTPIQNTVLSTNNNMNTAIIEKALKNTAKPDFTIDVKWDKYPSKEIEMLKDIMEIPEDEIVDWYLDNIQLEDFIIAFKEAIKERLFKGDKLPEDASVKVLGCIKYEAPVVEISEKTSVEDKPEKLPKPKSARTTSKKQSKK